MIYRSIKTFDYKMGLIVCSLFVHGSERAILQRILSHICIGVGALFRSVVFGAHPEHMQNLFAHEIFNDGKRQEKSISGFGKSYKSKILVKSRRLLIDCINDHA